MQTIEHSLVTLISMAKNPNREFKSNDELIKTFQAEIPYVLFPDAIRAYIPERESGHFEINSDWDSTPYMKYPKKEDVKRLSKENARQIIQTNIPSNIRKCVCTEPMSIENFDAYNIGLNDSVKHLYRAHLCQDVSLDRTLRSLVDVSRKFENIFVVNHSGEQIDPVTYKNEYMKFENLGLLRLAQIVYKLTGIIPNQQWFDEVVQPALHEAYSNDLATRTYGFMKIPEQINKKITNGDFSIDGYDLKIVSKDQLNDTYKGMYLPAIEQTILEQDKIDNYVQASEQEEGGR